MATVDDLRAAFHDYAAEAPTTSTFHASATNDHAVEFEHRTTTAHTPATRRQRFHLVAAIAVIAVLLVGALVAIRSATARESTPPSGSASPCSGAVSVCVDFMGTPWSVTLRVNGHLAPGILRPDAPHWIQLTEGTPTSFSLLIRHRPGLSLRNVYLYTYSAGYDLRDAQPTGRDVHILSHHPEAVPNGEALTGAWDPQRGSSAHDTYIAVSFRLGTDDRQVDVTRLRVSA